MYSKSNYFSPHSNYTGLLAVSNKTHQTYSHTKVSVLPDPLPKYILLADTSYRGCSNAMHSERLPAACQDSFPTTL